MPVSMVGKRPQSSKKSSAAGGSGAGTAVKAGPKKAGAKARGKTESKAIAKAVKTAIVAKPKPAVKVVPAPPVVAAKAAAQSAKPTRGKPAPERKALSLPEGYRPSEDEPFMNELHRLYFRQKLMAWKEDIIRETRATLDDLHAGPAQHADIADRATYETDRALELRARDRQRKLVGKIDSALARIEDGSYGFCEETGEPISLKRLEARPIATLSLEAQERHERRERVYREE